MEKNKLSEIQKELIICEKPSSYLEEIKDSFKIQNKTLNIIQREMSGIMLCK